MRSWQRVTYRERCGGCGNGLKKGDPMQVIELHGLRRKLIRCENCAGEAPPPLPELIEPESVEQRAAKISMQFIGSIAPEWLPHPDD